MAFFQRSFQIFCHAYLNLHSVMIIVGKYNPKSDSSSTFASSFLAYSDGGLVSVDLETRSVIYPLREVSMKKYQRMHLIFIRYIKQS